MQQLYVGVWSLRLSLCCVATLLVANNANIVMVLVVVVADFSHCHRRAIGVVVGVLGVVFLFFFVVMVFLLIVVAVVVVFGVAFIVQTLPL